MMQYLVNHHAIMADLGQFFNGASPDGFAFQEDLGIPSRYKPTCKRTEEISLKLIIHIICKILLEINNTPT